MAKIGGYHGEVHPGGGHPNEEGVHALAGGGHRFAQVTGRVGQVALQLLEAGEDLRSNVRQAPLSVILIYSLI